LFLEIWAPELDKQIRFVTTSQKESDNLLEPRPLLNFRQFLHNSHVFELDALYFQADILSSDREKEPIP